MVDNRIKRRAIARLIIHQLDQPDREVPLHGDGYRLGRDEHLELSINHPTVSRQHALLHRHGNHWLISDLNSTNGIWWQGKRVQELELRDGDRICVAPPSETGSPILRFSNPAELPWQRLWHWLGLVLLGSIGSAALLLILANTSLPVRGRLALIRGPLAIYDGKNQPLSTVDSSRHQELTELKEFSPSLLNALLASEDNRFWWHPGIDPIGTARALIANINSGKVIEGGSSLTQQLARSLYPEKVGQGDTLERKLRELLVTFQLEHRFSKADLLISYLNRVYLGVGWGFEDAAQAYFNKSAKDLQLEEAALLVGLLPSPNGFAPCQYPQRALKARNLVLNKMADNGQLSLDQARRTRRKPIKLASKACLSQKSERIAPFYSDQVSSDLKTLVGEEVAAEGNFLIETYLEPKLQRVVEQQLQQWLTNAKDLHISEGAAVVIDSNSGGVLAIAGGKDYRNSQFNRASMALRQPGSTFKLMVYLTALDQGFKPSDRIDCSSLNWRGQQFKSSCQGTLNLTSAFAKSSNTASLRLAQKVGLQQVMLQARALGISTPLKPIPGLALGQSEVHLIELTGAYAAVANNGIWHQPTTIRRLLDAETCNGGERKRCSNLTGQSTANLHRAQQAIKPAVAKQMQAMLRAVIQQGTGRSASLGGNEGGKTGTTNQGRDLLFIGYEPRLDWVLGIWLGNDDNSPSSGSSNLTASLWADIIQAASRERISTK